MVWLLDTNVLSELRKGDRCDARVQTWLNGVADADLFTSVLVIGEIRRGVELLRRRDPVAAAGLDHWLRRLSDTYAERILPINTRVAECWGALNVPNPAPTVDGLLAATAIVHDLTLVTRNTRNVAALGVSVLDPFLLASPGPTGQADPGIEPPNAGTATRPARPRGSRSCRR